VAVPTNAARQELFQIMVGKVRRDRGRTATEIAYEVANSTGQIGKGFSVSTYSAIARRAVESVRLAEELQDDPNRRPRALDVPAEVGIQPGAPRYQYSVVVRQRREGYAEVSWRVEYTSDTPLTYGEVAALANERIDEYPNRRNSTRRAFDAVRGEQPPDFFLVSVVRR
jgi:hypothetical protein